MDNELLLYDRLEVIKTTIKQYGEENFYLSFSGGKDSTVLHYLLDVSLPNNQIPRVFINTGIEYKSIVKFVKELAEKDNRIIIINSSVNIKKMLEEKGYPFKSKEHSLRVNQFNKGSNANFIQKYINGYEKDGKPSRYVCPKTLLYQFKERGKYNYSNLCCYEMKKKPVHKWAKENNRSIVITGMRKEEGGNRANIKGCVLTNNQDKVVKFHPLLVISDEFEDWFINKYNIQLCELYYPPYNFKRTGCKGCPFALDLQEVLDKMERYLPQEKAQCEILWKPVYEEYRRLNYRLSSVKQLTFEDVWKNEFYK